MRRTCFSLACWLLLCGAWLLACATARAGQPPLRVEKSTSPDGHLELLLAPSAEQKDQDGAYTGKITVRDVQSRAILSEFAWRSFEAPDRTTLSVLWSPDSRSFALHWPESERDEICAVYACSSGGTWQAVPLPKDLLERAREKARAAEAEGRIEMHNWAGEKGSSKTVTKWLPGRRFRVQGEYNGIWRVRKEDEQLPQLFWYTFRLEGGQGSAKLRAVLQSVEFAPASTQSTL